MSKTMCKKDGLKFAADTAEAEKNAEPEKSDKNSKVMDAAVPRTSRSKIVIEPSTSPTISPEQYNNITVTSTHQSLRLKRKIVIDNLQTQRR